MFIIGSEVIKTNKKGAKFKRVKSHLQHPLKRLILKALVSVRILFFFWEIFLYVQADDSLYLDFRCHFENQLYHLLSTFPKTTTSLLWPRRPFCSSLMMLHEDKKATRESKAKTRADRSCLRTMKGSTPTTTPMYI